MDSKRYTLFQDTTIYKPVKQGKIGKVYVYIICIRCSFSKVPLVSSTRYIIV